MNLRCPDCCSEEAALLDRGKRPRTCLEVPRVRLADAGPSTARTQSAGLGGAKDKPEDAAARSVPAAASGGRGTSRQVLKCGNCGAGFTREEALVTVADAEAELHRPAFDHELFRLDRARVLEDISDPDGALWPVNAYSDADELNGLVQAGLEAGVIIREDSRAYLYIYPLSLSESDPMLAVDLGQGPTLLGLSLKLRDREGENPVEFTVRLLGDMVDEANALLAHRHADSARLDPSPST